MSQPISVQDTMYQLCLEKQNKNLPNICFFGSLAEKYFDDKLRDATTNRCHKQKTIECFNKLSEEFTVDDVMKAFKMTLNTARMRVKRLQKDGAIEKCGEIIENGGKKFVYKKKGALIF